MNIDLSSCLSTAPGMVSKKAGHPHPDALLRQREIDDRVWVSGNIQLLVRLVQWSITSCAGCEASVTATLDGIG